MDDRITPTPNTKNEIGFFLQLVFALVHSFALSLALPLFGCFLSPLTVGGILFRATSVFVVLRLGLAHCQAFVRGPGANVVEQGQCSLVIFSLCVLAVDHDEWYVSGGRLEV